MTTILLDFTRSQRWNSVLFCLFPKDCVSHSEPVPLSWRRRSVRRYTAREQRGHPLWPRPHPSTPNPNSTVVSSSSKRCASREHTDKSVAQIARELGVPERVLYRWRRQLREAPEMAIPGKGHQSELEEENRRLRRELERVQQERDISKKSCPSSPTASHEVCLHRRPSGGVCRQRAVPGSGCVNEWLLRLAQADSKSRISKRTRRSVPRFSRPLSRGAASTAVRAQPG
jgi:transposase-like protein